jgi:hypothetical protein
MPAGSTEIGDEIAHQLDGVHRAHFCGIDMLKEMTSSAISRVARTDAHGNTRLVRRDAMHTDPQLLFAARASDHIMLAQELRTR